MLTHLNENSENIINGSSGGFIIKIEHQNIDQILDTQILKKNNQTHPISLTTFHQICYLLINKTKVGEIDRFRLKRGMELELACMLGLGVGLACKLGLGVACKP